MTNIHIDSALSELVGRYMGLIGIPSFAAFVGLYLNWISFWPEIAIESVDNKIKKLNSEAYIKIKNIGKSRAYGIFSEVDELQFRLDGISINGDSLNNNPILVPSLMGSESIEIPILLGISIEDGGIISECSYCFTLIYTAKIFSMSRKYKKTWKISLHNFGSEFFWDYKIV